MKERGKAAKLAFIRISSFQRETHESGESTGDRFRFAQTHSSCMIRLEKEYGLVTLPAEPTIPASAESKGLTTAGGQVPDRATIARLECNYLASVTKDLQSC